MFKKIGMLIIGLMIISSISFVSASHDGQIKLKVDGSWNRIQHFTFIDNTNNEVIWDVDVAAGKSHTKYIDQSHMYHQISIVHSVDASDITPKINSLIINMYDNADIELFGRLTNGCKKNWIEYRFDNFQWDDPDKYHAGVTQFGAVL